MSPVSLTMTLAQKPRKIPGCLLVADRLHGNKGTAPTCDDPELPEHHKCTTNAVGCHLSRVDRYSGVLRANTDTHDETSSEEFLPCPCEPGAYRGGSKTQGSDENFTTTTKVVIHWVDDECATNQIVS